MDSTALSNLRNKFVNEAKDLENELKELREKIRAIDLVRGMLIEQAGDKSPNQSKEGDTNRFRKMGVTEAILKCLNEPIRWWSVTEIKKTLLAGGFKTDSKHLSNIITSTLKRLKNVQIDKGVKPQKFKIKEIKEMTIDELLTQDKPTT